MKNEALTRREFLRTSAGAALAGALFLGYPGDVLGELEKETKVILIRDKDVLDEKGNPKPAVIRRMLDDSVKALLGEEDPMKAWERLIDKDDIVAIKTNRWGFLPTPEDLEIAIKERIVKVGVPESRIGMGDQGILQDSLFLNATALINIRPLRTHHWSGVGSLIKNYITFVKKPYEYHDDSCADLASIWRLPLVEGKTRLNILVLLRPLFHGLGPHHYSAEHTWPYCGFLVGFDPVAVDATGVRILLAKRKDFFGEIRPLTPPPKHVFLADSRHGLGTADPRKIDLIKIGWKEEMLI